MPTAIEFENISKQYRLGLVSTQTISHDLKRWFAMNIQGKEDPYLKIGEVNDREHKGESEYVWALRDINFKVEQGDVLGIIGKNGAGKSTLLKILSKVTAPSTGMIRARGRIASLLEVGTGFHPEMTGLENIFLNGAVLGMTKAEIKRKLDEIIDFSGVERYIDTPVKRYSSGMTVRLGFAIAAHLDPEILVVDEVLAVGDAEFQKKAIGKMQDVSKGEGRTVLFVSHNMDSMLNLCHKGILLENGSIKYFSDIEDTINFYMGGDKQQKSYQYQKNDKLIFVSEAEFTGTPENVSGLFYFDHPVTLKITIKRNADFFVNDSCIIGVAVLTSNGVRLFTVEKKLSNLFSSRNREVALELKLPNNLLAPGNYRCLFAIHEPNIQLYDNVEDVCSFTVFDKGTDYLKYNGVHNGYFIVEPQWETVK